MTLENLDDAFALTTNPRSFLNAPLLAKAKILCLLAACVWCIPLVATITPATLSIRSDTLQDNQTTYVPRPTYNNEYEPGTWVDLPKIGMFSPSTILTRLVAATISSGAVLPISAPFPNASYTLNFYGPAVTCQNLSTAVAADPSLQKIWDDAMGVNSTSGQTKSASAHKIYSASQSSVVRNYFFINMDDPSPDGTNYSCYMSNASYNTDFTFRNGIQSTTVRHPDIPHYINLSATTLDTFSGPGEVAFTAAFNALLQYITGYFQIIPGRSDAPWVPDLSTGLSLTGLLSCPEIINSQTMKKLNVSLVAQPWACAEGSVPDLIEQLFQNVTLSLMSSEVLSRREPVPVAVSTPSNRYSYDARNLLLAYGVAVAVAVAGVLVGAHAFVTNGYSANSSFSNILFMTRNPDLDRLVRGQWLGPADMPVDLRSTALRFGVVGGRSDDGAVARVGFGLEGTVMPLTKGDVGS